jgi:outer membrane biosynthesis protein TonB
MSAIKKPIYTPGESQMEKQAKRFNKRALIGSFIIHLFVFLIRFPQLELQHEVKDEPKLVPIKMDLVTPPPKKNPIVTKKVEAQIPPETKPVVKPPEKKVDNGTDRAIKDAKVVGDKTQKKVQDVQKGDPASRKKEAYKPGTEVAKTRRTQVGSGSAPSQVKSTDGNTGGSGDTYGGFDMTNVTDSIRKQGTGLQRAAAKGAKDDGGAGRGTGGGIGDGVGGGTGDGFITGSPNGTADIKKVATNIGSLTGSTTGKIDSSRGFDGLAQRGSVMVAGVPVERIERSGIDPNEIRNLLREHLPQFRHCYQSELDSHKAPESLQGNMILKFRLGTIGRASSIEIQSQEITADAVRDCIKNVLAGIQFPVPKGGATADINQPMYLYSKRGN